MTRITHGDIALRLGISQSTVSRALRSDPRIPPGRRRQIQQACAELGYQADARLSELASARWHKAQASVPPTIAYINHSRSAEVAGPISIPALEKQGALLGYRIETFHRGEYATSAKLQRVLRNRGITDLILGPVFDETLTVELDWEKFICVQVLPALSPRPFHSVVRDNFNSVLLAWRKAVARGHRRIGITLVSHHTAVPLPDDLLRSSAIHACQTELFPELPAIVPFKPVTDWPTARRLLAEWVAFHRPDVVIGFNDSVQLLYHPRVQPAFISLHKNSPGGCPGVLSDIPLCSKEAVNLLHFCRRTYQWGIPENRIDHLVEPTWFDGDPPRETC